MSCIRSIATLIFLAKKAWDILLRSCGPDGNVMKVFDVICAVGSRGSGRSGVAGPDYTSYFQ